MLELYWTGHGPSEGTTDYFPLRWFAGNTTIDSTTYEMRQRDGSIVSGRVSVNVRNNSAVIGYSGTDPRYFVSGKYRITFSDISLFEIGSIEWSDDYHAANFSAAPVIVTIVDDSGIEEGGATLSIHLRRERNPVLRKEKIADVLKKKGNLACEACGFDFAQRYGHIGERFCEVHHRRALAAGERISNLDDLAVLCSNCHSMIHKTNPLMSVGNFSNAYLRKIHGPGN